ncbi:amino acid adenylation domain-containing protein [Sporobacter termitidis DSM 10068]|uniref:Amino acid adenylation domain-containing protein n=1 Tax=Sporobacter termitidis DSM 10068 TaxID=1123282 RepID=A0A1M5XRF8_9FIRM|nr:non-ribosomal peptide synthetase [Sporobacter termitidis]SHI02336.1 amino acid adenylation domain-containing protein [Sporobacter termitidis DSM 10068]
MSSEKIFHQLSESQKSIWYLEKAYPGTSINIVAGTLRLRGEISYPALQKALNLFVRKSDAMRIRIHESDGVAAQYVTDYEEFPVDFFDFSQGDGLKNLFAWDESTTRTPFDITSEQLFYCATFKVGENEGGFYMKMHHLISDAWTMGLVTRQVIDFYSKIKKGLPVDDFPNPSFVQHLVNEAEYERSARFENDKAYWLHKFETLPEMSVLKPQKSSGVSILAKRKTLITPLKLSNKIREFCSASKLSIFTLFMSALAVYINRVTGIEDIVLGTTILNRTNAKDKETPGMFVSVAAPLRITVDDTKDFRTFAASMLKESTDVLRHQKYPYNYLLRDLKKKHKLGGRLFDIVLSYQNSKFHKDETDEDYTGKWLFSGCQVESLIISVNDREDGGNLVIDYDFLCDVFDIKEIEFIHQHIISLLWHALDNPAKSISKLEMISEKEKHKLLREFNNTYADFPMDKTIGQMFEEQADRSPDSAALLLRDKEMTYSELNRQANRLAATLREKGVGPDKVVGIMAYRGFELIVGILGILKAGGAYLPIDPEYPKERRKFMFADSGAALLLTKRALIDTAGFTGEVLDLDDASSYTGDGRNLPPVSSSGDLAYVIYTSGSTGKPKGVMLRHAGVVNSFCWGVKKFGLKSDSVILQKTAPTFDPSVWEIFWWLMLGGKVCLIDSGDEKDPEAIISAIERYQVTVMHFVPSMMGLFLNYVDTTASDGRLASLRQVFSCGEAISLNTVEYFNQLLYKQNGTRLYNMYGPTEATVEVACFDCSPGEELTSVPIGQRIDNFSIYILDKNRNLLPVGIPGEIYIGGVGVARGYLNNPALTAERFVENPFVHGEKIYRTGDKARWYPKGDIEFLGRMDFQVKVKGFRIETGEIEARLLTHPDILEAAVKSFRDEGGVYLAAYVVAGKAVGAEDIRQYLAETLPEYMIPGCVVFLDKMPLNNNGKTDRNALPAPENHHVAAAEYTPPSNGAESALCDIWARALGLGQVGVSDEYSVLGGDSLTAIRIITDIHKSFGVEISPKLIFQLQTVKRLAARLETLQGRKAEAAQIPRVAESAWYPASSAQKRQFILNSIDGGVSYNLPGGMEITGKIDAGRVNDVFKKIVARHETLRTSFELRDGEPVQVVHQDVAFAVEYAETAETDYERLMEGFIRPFDLSAAPLLRVRLVKLADSRHVLMFDMHHIVSDGASINIIIREFLALYAGGTLPELKIQYRDYAAWHNARLRSDKLIAQEAYWLERFSGEVPVLNLPLDYARPSFQSFHGNKLYFIIDEALTAELKKLMAKTGTTLFMLLLSAYNVLLSKYSGQEDIVVGTPVEGRLHADLRELVGMFVNTLAIRSRPAGHKTFTAFLSEVKEDLLNAYENQEYPFEELVGKVVARRDTSRNPLFDTTFILQNMDLSVLSTEEFTAAPYAFGDGTSKFDLSLEASDMGGIIECSIEYCTDLFGEDTIRRLSSHFLNTLGDIVKDPSKKLCDIGILSEAERHRLLCEFNDTDAEYPREKTIHRIFEERASEAPGSTALVLGDKAMTYGALNERANRLARTLRARGVGPDDIAGLVADRSLDMVVGVLGILKAGGAYMPIDPEYPAERQAYMLKDSGAKVLLTKKGLELPFEGMTVCLDDEAFYAPDGANLVSVSKPSDLAYIIYTSGSTGKPKGVMIEHRNVVRLLFNDKFQFAFDKNDTWTLFHSCCFDFSVWEMYGALLYGGRLIVVPKEDAVDTRRFLGILKAGKVTVLNQTPSAFYNLIGEDAVSGSELPALRYVIFGGEALKPPMVRTFKEKYPQTKLVNMYGITETTVHVTFKEITLADTEKNISNVGTPIPSLKVYVLDSHLHLLPVGVPGEICVGGAGVARGYLNNKALTEQRFVELGGGSGRIYRSGDLGRFLENGDIEYLGRIDDQVKIRGYRIELGELESALLRHPDIEETVVTVHESGGGDKRLCAYFKSKTELTAKELAPYLSGVLPEYMIPSYFIRLEAFPLNRNGKIDRPALPKPNEVLISSADTIMPRSVTEELMANAWADVLELKTVGVNDNFFELGGDSLSAIRVVSMLKLGINIVDFYTNPTIRQLTEKLNGAYAGSGLLVDMTRRRNNSGRNIVCFPYGGGSALAYRDISNAILEKDPDAKLYAVDLPGHDYGVDLALRPIEETAADLVREISENLTGEIVLYGHCVGSALLLATASGLQKAGVPVRAAFIGGVLVPKLIRLYGGVLNPWSLCSDKYIVRYLNRIGLPQNLLEDSAYIDYIIKAFRHDAKCFTGYIYARLAGKAGRLEIPLHLIVGDRDTTTRRYQKRYRQWRRFFESVDLTVLPGAFHYFINTHADALAEYLLSV